MACGTPVIAFKQGSVVEVIDEGKTGFVVEDFESMCYAVNNIKALDRQYCRAVAMDKFDISIISDKYINS
jgi:glycosyltransferase involved in cell wall biosynthesis